MRFGANLVGVLRKLGWLSKQESALQNDGILRKPSTVVEANSKCTGRVVIPAKRATNYNARKK